MLKPVFEQSKKLQKKVMLLSNLFRNRLDDFVNSSDKEDVIYHCQTKNARSPWLLSTKKNRVTGHFAIKEGVLWRNRNIGHSTMEEKAIEKNRVICHSEMEEEIKDANEKRSEVSFLYQKIIKYN